MSKSFKTSQEDYFTQSCNQRFRWQTKNSFVSHAERELLKCLPIEPNSQVLELGCGTGSNLYNLRAIGQTFGFTGVDINHDEIEIAKQNFPDDQFLVGDATNVKLDDQYFDLVFCRDVIHHINPSDQIKLIQEMTRLTKIGGKVVVIESNGLNFVVWAFGKLVKAERYVIKSTPNRIAALISQVEKLETSQLVPDFLEPWNFFRFVLHYKLGLPNLAESYLICGILKHIISVFSRISPPHKWAYMVFITFRKY